MTETPLEGRGGLHAALPLASSATDRNLRACLFWDVVLFSFFTRHPVTSVFPSLQGSRWQPQ